MITIYEIALSEALKAGNGKGYSEQVAEEIQILIDEFLVKTASGSSQDAASSIVEKWIGSLREHVSRKEMSASWGANFLVLLITTVRIGADYYPELTPLRDVFNDVCDIDKKHAHWFK